MKRPSWDSYFIDMLDLIQERVTCIRRSCSAIIVRDNHILSTGYNGPPSGTPHCTDIGCLREELKIPSGERHELCRAVHAEQNAIVQAAKHGVSLKDSTSYINTNPCSICAKLLINVGIKKIIIKEFGYPDSLALEMLYSAKVRLSIHGTGEFLDRCVKCGEVRIIRPNGVYFHTCRECEDGITNNKT